MRKSGLLLKFLFVFFFTVSLPFTVFCKEKDQFLKDYRKAVDELEDLSKAVAKNDGEREKYFKERLESFSAKSKALQNKVSAAGFGDVFSFDKYPSAMVYARKNGDASTVKTKDNGKKLSINNQMPDAAFVFDLIRYDLNVLRKLKFSYADGAMDRKYQKYPRICKFRYYYVYYKNPVKAESGKAFARGVFEKRLELMKKAAKYAEMEAKEKLQGDFKVPPIEDDAETISAYYLRTNGAWQDVSAHSVSKKLSMNGSLKEEYAFAIKSIDDFFNRFDEFVTAEEKARVAAEKAEKKAKKEAEKEERKRAKAEKNEPPEKSVDELPEEPSVEEKKEEKKIDGDDAVIWRDGGSGVWK